MAIVGRDVIPAVGMKVCEILGGFGPGKQEEGIQTGERTGTISKVIGRVAAHSQNSKTLSCGIVWEAGGEMQLKKTGLGGNYDLVLSSEDPSHPSNTPAESPSMEFSPHPNFSHSDSLSARSATTTRRCSAEREEHSDVSPPAQADVLEAPLPPDEILEKPAPTREEPEAWREPTDGQQEEAMAGAGADVTWEEGLAAKARGQKNLMKLRASVKVVTATQEFTSHLNQRIEARKKQRDQDSK